MAVNEGSLSIAEILIQNGANINQKSLNGLTPLHITVITANANMVNLLLSKGADPGIKNDEGKSALDMAISKGNKEILACFNQKGEH